MKNCIYKRGKDTCTSKAIPNCPYFKSKRMKDFGDMKVQICFYNEAIDPLVSYRVIGNRKYAERRAKDNG